ncbi:Ivy family c-type lysozyme inhibitor [Rhizobium rhizogenes]|uniref:Ivy family c-type lysozyme inhibitor n=1 Tax=Rhizobium rhizogenes TaxID=359 RepID=UPI001573EF8D|nr:Ivy family c-type lysozyme inhibitor [Rhizobium rhizogenes]NTF43516.1 C-lysozyme inhibitor [Rhizobium rhizogenes]
MKKLMMAAALASTLLAATSASAENHPATFREIAADPAATAAFKAMAKGHTLPDWINGKTVESPGNEVTFGGDKVYVMSACKQHDCGSERIAVMYYPAKKIMYGLLLSADQKTVTEKLTWLNIGPGNEAIDGRTILYAALTGSLENHPGAFDYK